MVTANENLNLVQNMYKALNKQDLDAHDDYWTKDMIWHGPPRIWRYFWPRSI